VDAVFAKDGAMEALRQAQEQKMVRYLGVTGHFRPAASRVAIARIHLLAGIRKVTGAMETHYSRPA
jgi:hypothetical protein